MANIPDAAEGDVAAEARIAPSGTAGPAADVAEPAPDVATEPPAPEPDLGTEPVTEPTTADPPAPVDPAPASLTEPPPGDGPAPAVAVDPDPEAANWARPTDWQAEPGPYPDAGPELAHHGVGPDVAHHDVPAVQHFDEPDEYDDEWSDEYDDVALFASIFSAPSLALAAFVFALTGLLGGMIPQSLPYLVQIDPTNGPAYHVRILGLIALGFAIVAASLGLAAMLRSIGSPLRWPRYLGGAAVLLALLIALQSVLLIVLAWYAPEQGGMN